MFSLYNLERLSQRQSDMLDDTAFSVLICNFTNLLDRCSTYEPDNNFRSSKLITMSTRRSGSDVLTTL